MSGRFAADGFGHRARIGLVYMASSVVMEPEMYAMAGPGVSIHTSRLSLPAVTVRGIDAMMRSPQLEQAVSLVAEAPVDVVVFGGTSASFLHGAAWDAQLVDLMERWTGRPGRCTTTSTASLAALKHVGAGPIALATPYVDEVVQRAREYFTDNGFSVVASQGLGITHDHQLAEVPLKRIYEMCLEVDSPDVSAIFISCTNLRSIGLIERLEQQLGKPVVSAVQASFWHCLELAGVPGAGPGFGRLLSNRITQEEVTSP